MKRSAIRNDAATAEVTDSVDRLTVTSLLHSFSFSSFVLARRPLIHPQPLPELELFPHIPDILHMQELLLPPILSRSRPIADHHARLDRLRAETGLGDVEKGGPEDGACQAGWFCLRTCAFILYGMNLLSWTRPTLGDYIGSLLSKVVCSRASSMLHDAASG